MFVRIAGTHQRCNVMRTGAALLCLLAMHGRMVAANESLGYFVERWSVEEGLPNHAITSVIQTRDGYLWISTWAGIARFDGVRFTPVADNLPNDHARAIVEDTDGSVWVGMSGMGVARWRPRGVDVVTPAQGLAGVDVRRLALDDGRLWVATENGVSVIDGERVLTWRTDDGLPSSVINGLSRGPRGGVWIATARGLCQAMRLQVQCRRDPSDATLIAVLEGRDGLLWVGTDRGLLAGNATLAAELTCQGDCFPGRSVTSLMQARDGGLWIGFADGAVVHRLNGVETRYGAVDGLPAGRVEALFEDEEGSVWAALVNGGLARFRPKRVAMLTTADGLVEKVVGSIVQDAAGTIWAGTECSPVSELRNGRFYPRLANYTKDACAQVLWAARDGSLWIGTTNRGLFRWHDGRMEHFGLEEGLSDTYIRGLFEDRDGAIWIGTAVGGLHYYAHGRLSRSFGEADGVATGILASFAQDREGRVWIGSNANGLSVYEDGRFRRLGDSESPPSRSIASLLIDSRGDLWIGTASHGLFRRRNGRYEPFGVAQGLSHALVALMIEDREGTLWVATGHGISRLTRVRIDEVAAGRRASLDPIVLDRRDGLLNLEGSGGGFDPSGLRDRDGRLWFSTIDGIAVVDPATFRFNAITPRVIIESVSLAGRLVATNENGVAEVPAGTAAIDLAYTAPSFLAPEQLRFRVRLRGLDDAWQEVGNRRVAYYTRLAPGHYTFEVMATSGDGLSSAQPAALQLVVAPFWWERRIVQATGAGLLLFMTAVVVRKVSLRRAHARLAELEREQALDHERARIARDLHDDLGSRLAHIAILAETSGAIDHDRRIVRAAREAAETMDELVWTINARNDTLESFAYYLGQFAEEYVSAAGLRCRLEIPLDLPDHPLAADVRRHLYLASKEAVTNAVKHARASEVGVTLRLADGALVLEISDNGGGLPAGLDPTGNGLRNLRERMTAAGGAVEVESAVGAGTRIRCTVPMPGVTVT